jgi:hypothetical protein
MEIELFNKSIFKFLFFDQYLNNGKGENPNIICHEFYLYMMKLDFRYSSNLIEQFKYIFSNLTNYQEKLDEYLILLEVG